MAIGRTESSRAQDIRSGFRGNGEIPLNYLTGSSMCVLRTGNSLINAVWRKDSRISLAEETRTRQVSE